MVGINDINNNKPVFQEVTELQEAAWAGFPGALTPQLVPTVSQLQSERRGCGKPAPGYRRPAGPGPGRGPGRERAGQVRHHAQRRRLVWLPHRP